MEWSNIVRMGTEDSGESDMESDSEHEKAKFATFTTKTQKPKKAKPFPGIEPLTFRLPVQPTTH